MSSAEIGLTRLPWRGRSSTSPSSASRTIASRSGAAAFGEAVAVALCAGLPGLALDPRHRARLTLSRLLPPLD